VIHIDHYRFAAVQKRDFCALSLALDSDHCTANCFSKALGFFWWHCCVKERA